MIKLITKKKYVSFKLDSNGGPTKAPNVKHRTKAHSTAGVAINLQLNSLIELHIFSLFICVSTE